MTKTEYKKCENVMDEAIRHGEDAKEEFKKAESCKDLVEKSILLAQAHNNLGYTQGINQVLVSIGFKHDRMKELQSLL